MVPENMLLEPPFEGACLYPKNTERRWYNKKRFIIPVSILTAILILGVVLGSVLGSRSTNNVSGMRFDFLFKSKTNQRQVALKSQSHNRSLLIESFLYNL
ncbi:unnamed protein product [Rotaria sordida]|uniref:Uncharacterized protein n=1 Tax=Rotaria sordida TaxID=392033 RepID=A0A814TZA2_9BILA|nr:unnamed protein product [Rotaria sordida]CAF1167979.1 unnamed protein product [Rotaria sordida]